MIIKKGEPGTFVFVKNKAFFATALPLEEVLDPTGAGDSFAGGFIGYIAKTKDISFENMKRAVLYGTVMASFTVEKFGTENLSMTTKEEIDSRLKSLKKISQIS